MKVIDQVHGGYVHLRRVRVLCEHLSKLIPTNASVLDVGCGDGLLASLIQTQRPDITISGVDTLVRANTQIPVRQFDGVKLPFANGTFDIVMFVDVLHHTEDPMILLRESVRVAAQSVLIKDHTMNGTAAYATLKFMDDVSNKRHGVSLPHNYWPEEKWRESFQKLGLSIGVWKNRLGLYPWPANLIFERKLHFVARLDKK